jgi:hypothetical protein
LLDVETARVADCSCRAVWNILRAARLFNLTNKETTMSAPQTNIEKQRRRHRGPLIGMALVVVFGVLLITWWLFEEASQASNTTPTPAVSTTNVPASTGAQPVAPSGG